MPSCTIQHVNGGTTYGFVQWNGAMPRAGVVQEDVTKGGVDGKRHRDIGYMAEPSTISATGAFMTLVAAELAAHGNPPTTYGYSGLQGAFVNIYDEHGGAWYNVYVQSVDGIQIRRADGAGGTLYEVDVTWTLDF